ncbi:MAG: A/G-specific adenine glycosylase [Ignavibacteriota bacterium]
MSLPKRSADERERFDRIQKVIIHWYKTNRRTFSWRKKIRDPYEVLVCEVMAQQTQASRIEDFLPAFLKKFPNISALANAKRSDVVRAWQGLGYNRRALNLHQTAKLLATKTFPDNEQELLALPGIGKYTARAILIFAFNRPIATIDVNILRLLSRLSKKMLTPESVRPTVEILPLAEHLVPRRQPRLWNEALMDFGATTCTKRNPKCSTCPLLLECRSGKNFLKFSIQTAPKAISKELKFFGHPKRIWRGRVLKLIAENERISNEAILSSFGDSSDDHFREFIDAILRDLVDEGFCSRRYNKYQLQ